MKPRGGQRFTKLDLKSAYQQLPLDTESQQFVTINTHGGLYRYNRLPFGIASSPDIDIIIQGLDHVVSIQDDILITVKDQDEHFKNLDSVLSRLHHYGLLLQLSKCKFICRNQLRTWAVSSLPAEFLLRRKGRSHQTSTTP